MAPQRDEIFKQKVNDCVQHIILQKFTNFHAIRSWNFQNIFNEIEWPHFLRHPVYFLLNAADSCSACYAHRFSARFVMLLFVRLFVCLFRCELLMLFSVTVSENSAVHEKCRAFVVL